jgi:hypothetical protein
MAGRRCRRLRASQPLKSGSIAEVGVDVTLLRSYAGRDHAPVRAAEAFALSALAQGKSQRFDALRCWWFASGDLWRRSALLWRSRADLPVPARQLT